MYIEGAGEGADEIVFSNLGVVVTKGSGDEDVSNWLFTDLVLQPDNKIAITDPQIRVLFEISPNFKLLKIVVPLSIFFSYLSTKIV
jgi:hypothetical protein